MRKENGFSLIELVIVVVILGIIAAIAIPNLLAARRSSNEGSAVASLRTLHGAENVYGATHGGSVRYGTLADLGAAQLIDSRLAQGEKSGYVFSIATGLTPEPHFAAKATPQVPTGTTRSGDKDFGVGNNAVIHTAPVGGISIQGGTLSGGEPYQP